MSRCPAVRLRPLLLASSVLIAAPAFAESEDPERREETVTIYGTSNPIPVFEYPGQVSVIDRSEIDLRQPSAPSDLLRDVPGLEFSGGPRRTGEVPSIRGLSGENLLILVDGARQSFISAHDGRFFLDPGLLQRAEVVRGPASALYGSGAVGGVLAFETVDADDLLDGDQTWGARLRGGYQSVNEEQFATGTVYGQTGRLQGLASLGFRQSGDIALGSGVDLASDDEIDTGLVKLGYQLSDALSTEVSWQGFGNTAVEPNNGQGTAGTGDSVLDRDVNKTIESDILRWGVSFDPQSAWIDADITAYRSESSVDEFDPTVPRTTVREIETTGLGLRNAARVSLGPVETVLTVGGDWYRDEQTGLDTTSADGRRAGVPRGESEFLGAFLQAEMVTPAPLGLPGDVTLIPGVRYDEFESRADLDAGTNSDEAVSPRLAASYGPVSWFRIFGSYAEGFRAPSINELYLDGVHFPLPHPTLFDPRGGQFVFVNNNFVPNPDLKPEKSETVEIGFGVDFRNIWQTGDRLQGKVSAYESEVDDLIDLSVNVAFDPTCFQPPAFFPCTAGTTESANVARAELDGVEADIAYESARFYARATYAAIDGTDPETGADVGTLTPDRLALDLGTRLPARNAQFGTRIQLADSFKRFGVGDSGALEQVERREGYVVLDLYASWQPDFAEGLRLDIGVENLFDHDYDRVFEGVSEPGRNVKLAATYSFG